ncbi:hypothetical protein BT96DRAFT_944698 [Gymnopus androsaceus JB14]|uniref:Uncharacterized protein n=1 Tax=Gymnopus androsaceus JB14 TaxID=1447944 RepID=A0A6A4H4M6_9AGAR|nr:hypothetical protein BT96DRAFT_944698 [Gymnopus androsaceus JB14]
MHKGIAEPYGLLSQMKYGNIFLVSERIFHSANNSQRVHLARRYEPFTIWNSAKEAAKTAAETARIEEDLAILRDRVTVPLPPAGSDLLPTKLEESIWQRAQEAEVTEDEIILGDMAFFALPTRYVPITPPIPDPSYDGYMCIWRPKG